MQFLMPLLVTCCFKIEIRKMKPIEFGKRANERTALVETICHAVQTIRHPINCHELKISCCPREQQEVFIYKQGTSKDATFFGRS